MPSGRVETDSIACSTVVSTQSSRTITPTRHCQTPSRSKNSGSSVSFFFTVWELNMFDTIFFGARQTQKARGETKDAPTTLTPRSSLLATSSVIEKSDEIPHDSERSDGSPVARPNLVRTSGRIRDGRPVTATARSNPLYLLVILLSGLDNSFAQARP